MVDRRIEVFNEMYPSAFWLGFSPSEAYSELRKIAEAFKLWAQAQPSMPWTVSGNTELFEAFKRGWLEEKANRMAFAEKSAPREDIAETIGS